MIELLMYDPTSPSGLRWRVDGYRNTYRAGDAAGCTHSGPTGYYQIVIRGKNRTIGSFDTALDARAAYLRAKLEEHGFVPGVVYS